MVDETSSSESELKPDPAQHPSEQERALWSDWSVPDIILDLWEERLPSLIERTKELDQALQSREPLGEDARMAAHKLRGSLGTFGFRQGSVVAGRVEDFLKNPSRDPADRQTLAVECRKLLRELTSRLPSDGSG